MANTLERACAAFFSSSEKDVDSPRFVSSVNDVLYFWHNDMLRVQNKHAKSYESRTISPPFRPTGMKISSDQVYVLLHSDEEIYVASPFKDEFPKLYKSPKPIKMLLWHPLAIIHKCIVILHTDDTIRVVELNEPGTLGGKIYNDKTKSFGLSERIHMIKDIRFDPTGLTLYLLTSQNYVDLFIIYPLLPPRVNLGSESSSQTLTSEADATSAGDLTNYMLGKSLASAKLLKMKYLEERNAFLKNMDTHKAEEKYFESRYYSLRRDILKQIRFFKDVREQLPNSFLVDSAYLESVPQGPFRLRGLPSNLETVNAVSLNILSITQTLAVLCVTFEDGNNLLLFPSSEPIMSWSKRESNEWTVLDTITVFKESGRPIISRPSEMVFLSETGCDIVKIPWLKKLADCIRLNSISGLQDLQYSNEVTHIDGNYEGVVSCCSSLILFDNIGFKILNEEEDKKESPMEATEQVSYNYTPLVAISAKEIDLLVQKMSVLSTKYPTSVPISIASKLLGPESDVSHLEAVSSASKEIMERVQLGQTLILRLINKVTEQRNELYRQLKKLNEVSVKKEQVTDRMQQLQTRLSEYESKASLLEPRLQKLRETIRRIEESDSIRNSSISEAEKSWFKTLRDQVIKFNSYVKEQTNLREELKFLKQQVSNRNLEEKDSQMLELENLQKMLLQDRKIILSCSKNITSALHEIKG